MPSHIPGKALEGLTGSVNGRWYRSWMMTGDHQESKGDRQMRSINATASGEPGTGRSAKRILVVDNDPFVRRMTADWFAANGRL